MGNDVFSVADGWTGYYASLPAADDALILVALRGVEADETLRARTTLADVLTANTEANFTGYARKVLTGVTTTIDPATGRRVVDFDDGAWNPAGGATNNTVVKLIACYRPASGSADSAIVPMQYYDFVHTTDGQSLGWAVNPAGAWRAQSQAA